MAPIFRAQWLQLKHNPLAFIIMVVLSIGMTIFIGGQTFDRVTVSVLPDSSMNEAEVENWLELLDDSDTFAFELGDERAVLDSLASSNSGLAVRLFEDDWQVLHSVGDNNAQLLAAHVGAVYRRELTLQAAGGDTDLLREQVQEQLETPAMVVVAAEQSTESAFAYDVRVHTLIGMGLFFATFTIMFNVTNILEDRRLGVWDRVIQSATPRSAMYAGHLTFSFVLGLFQILLVFSIFTFLFGVDLGQNWLGVLAVISLFTLAIVALGLFMAGLVRTPAQMQVFIPIVAVSSAMLGGAYWPIEIVSNPVMLALSRVVPIRYALDALKGIVYHDYSWSQLSGPLAVLAGFAVLFMVLGLWLVDRRR